MTDFSRPRNPVAYGLKPHVIDEIISAAQRNGVQKLILFGSRARGTYSCASDIDLGVYGGNVREFHAEVEETVPTLLRFDVIDMGRPLSPDFRKQIEEGVVLYEEV